MSRQPHRALILSLALAGLAPAVPGAAALDGPPAREVAAPGNLNRQIDHLTNLLRDGRGREDREMRAVRLARLRDGTPLAMVVFHLRHYRGANNQGAFLAAFAGDDAPGRPAAGVHYRLLGVAKTGETEGRIDAEPVLAGEEQGQVVVRLTVTERRPGDPAGRPACRRAAEYRFKRELLHWSGEGAEAILPGPGPCGD